LDWVHQCKTYNPGNFPLEAGHEGVVLRAFAPEEFDAKANYQSRKVPRAFDFGSTLLLDTLGYQPGEAVLHIRLPGVWKAGDNGV
jgi:hypothetical protein